MIIGGAVITNAGTKCNFVVENTVPILRDKDILSTDKANTPARRIYFSIQLMYIDEYPFNRPPQSVLETGQGVS